MGAALAFAIKAGLVMYALSTVLGFVTGYRHKERDRALGRTPDPDAAESKKAKPR